MDNLRRFKITEIAETRYNMAGQAYTVYREVQVVRGFQRFGHYILDYLALQGISYLLGYAIGYIQPEVINMNEDELLIYQLKLGAVGLGLNFLYYSAFEGFFSSTPGKMLMGRVVINEYGERLDFPKAMLRTVIRWIPFEAISCLWPRGWHDQWSKTFVVTKGEADHLWDALTKMESDTAQREANEYLSGKNPSE